MKKFLTILIPLFLSFTLVTAQFYDLKQYRFRTEEFISSELATCFLRDSKGFIWIGTLRGLNRYDGYNFKTYYHDILDTNSISDDYINCLCEDHEGKIWIGTTYGGLNKYDPVIDVFKHYPKDQNDTYNLRRSNIAAVCTMSSGDIWFSIHGPDIETLYKINPKTEKIQCIAYDTVNPGVPYHIHSHAICQSKDGNIWSASHEGLLKYDSVGRGFIKFSYDPIDPSSISSDVVTAICEDSDGILWIGTWRNYWEYETQMGGLNQFNRNTKCFLRYLHETGNPNSLSTNEGISAITEDNDGNLIVRTVKGVDFLNKHTGQFTCWKHNTRAWALTGYNILTSLYWDKSGILWFGVPQYSIVPAGIYKLVLKRKHFIRYNFDQLGLVNLGNRWISSIYEDRAGNIWVGGFRTGLIKIVNPHHQPSFFNYHADPDNPNSLSSDNISAIYQDNEGTLWIGCWDGGVLNKLDLSNNTERFIHYKPEPNLNAGISYSTKIPFRRISDFEFTGAGSMRFYEDSKGHLWIARGIGLELFDRDEEIFYSCDIDQAKNDLQNIPLISAISEGKLGSLWIGTMYQGIFKIIPPLTFHKSGKIKGKKTISYKYDKDTPKDLGDLMITTLCVPRINSHIKLWIGTWGGGVFGLTSKKISSGDTVEQFINYSVSDGLPDNIVLGILEDESGYLWLSTYNGLSKFDPQKEIFNNFNKTDGASISRFHWLSSHKSKTGKMYFGGENGLLFFYPDSIYNNPTKSPVLITDFKLFNKKVPVGENSPLKKVITETTELELSYRENYLSFEFAALNYINTEKNQYKYKMEGLDMEWIDAGTTRNATYTALKHGKYIFKVKGSNNDGVWNEEGASISIFISPPPWLSWWAYIIYGLILFGIILWYRRFLMNRAQIMTALEVERVEKEKVQELDHMKSRFFANISHEFRTPLTLLLGPIEDLLKSKSDRDEKERGLFKLMQRNARRLQLLINQLLDLSKLETNKVKLQVSEADFTEFIRAIILSFLSLAESKNIDYQYDIPGLSGQVYYDADKLEKILTNLLSNAFKFTPVNGKVSVNLQYVTSAESGDPQFADISVSDTGKGIPKEQLDRIFDRFYQVSDSDTRDAEGTGIGLALTRELVDLYRGEISVESEVGKGSIFRVRLPISKDQFKEEENVAITPREDVRKKPVESELDKLETEWIEMKESQIREKTKGAPIVLIVEDNIDLRNYISKNLGDSYQILNAENGKTGFELAIESIPDMVISDVMMPVMDGMEMCRHLKTDERTNHIPVIMLTARADRGSKMAGLEIGADDYIIKPFDADELQVRVRNLIEQHRRLREKFRKELISESSENLPLLKDQFFSRLMKSLDKNISEPEFTMEQLGKELYMSRAQLYRKVTSITGMTPNELLQMLRMKHAARLLLSPEYNVAQIMYQVGMRSTSYFAQSFRKYYGTNPSEYRHSQKKL